MIALATWADIGLAKNLKQSKHGTGEWTIRLIDADATVKLTQIATAKELYEGELTKRLGNSYNYHAIAAGYKAAIDDMTQAIKAAPTIDAVPVVHGRWKSGGILNECQVCGEIYSLNGGNVWRPWNYCPNCGAKMDGEADG
jgi:hypothetical protein